jgi:hypothetical protein
MLVQIADLVKTVLKSHRFQGLLHQVIDIFCGVPQVIIQICYLRHDAYAISQTSGQVVVQFLQLDQIGLEVLEIELLLADVLLVLRVVVYLSFAVGSVQVFNSLGPFYFLHFSENLFQTI